MKILLIQTAGGDGSVALADTEAAPALVAMEALPGRTASERLVPAVRRLMEAVGWSLTDLAAIAVVHGPGSFTGVRVGVAAAKGLSEAAGVPLIAISRLALVAAALGEREETTQAVLDAGRGEFYYGEYAGSRCVREALLTGEAMKALAWTQRVVTSEEKVVAAMVGLGLEAPRLIDEPSAGDALPLTLERIADAAFDDPALLDANYLRRTDAEIFAKPAAPR